MGRGATKAASNPWYKARLEAAKWNDMLSSRAGAADMFHCSIDTIDRIENGLNKCMSVDMAVLMADKYNAPHVQNVCARTRRTICHSGNCGPHGRHRSQ